MKRKIFLPFIIATALICLFAISVSAATITYEGQEITVIDNLGAPSWYTGDVAQRIQDKESLVILKDDEGAMTAYPSYYVFRYLIDGSGVRITWADQNGVDYSFINESNEKNYAPGSLYYAELPYGLTTCTAVNIWDKSEKNVVEIVIPDSVTSISYNAFSNTEKLKRVTISKNVKVIDEWAFHNSKGLEAVIFPKGCAVESMAKGSFMSCSKISYFNLENCKSLKSLGDSALSGCTSISKLALPDSLETIGFQALYNLGELELASDYLPTSLKTIGDYFLSDCQVKNEFLYFPEGFSSLNSAYNFIGTYKPQTSLTLVFLGKMTSVNLERTPLTSFVNNGTKQPLRIVFAQNVFSDLNGPVVPLVELNGQKGFIFSYADKSPLYSTNEGTLTLSFDNWSMYNGTSLGKDANGNTVYLADSPIEMIFCGDGTPTISYSIRCNHTDKGWYRFPTTCIAYDLDAHAESGIHYNHRVYQAGNCGYDEVTKTTCVACKLESVVIGEKATGEHSCTDDYSCETPLTCNTCGKTVVEALTHIIATTILYENGYTESGIKKTACQNAGCNHILSEEATDSLLACLGYSVSESGAGIVLGFSVNSDAIAEYMELSKNVLELGVFAVAQSKLGDNDIFGVDGKPSDGVVSAKFPSLSLTMFNIKVSGFSDKQGDIKLAMGAYVATIKDGKAQHACFQSGPPIGDDKYFFASYNEMISEAG